jgi:hypothetical protein
MRNVMLRSSQEAIRWIGVRGVLLTERVRNAVNEALVEEDGDLGDVLKIAGAVVLLVLLVGFGKEIFGFIKEQMQKITGGG